MEAVQAPAHPCSMEPVSGGKLTVGLKVHLLLFYVGTVGACTVSVTQPPFLEVDYTHNSVTIECTFSSAGCPTETPACLWFRYGAHQSETLCTKGCQSEADKFTLRKALEQHHVSLTVNRVAMNDSAIYICGIAFPSSRDSKAKQTGEGTILVVREIKLLSKETRTVLIALSVLLSFYIIGVGVIFTILSKSKSNSLRNKGAGDSQKKMSARRIFQDIAQELYRKRYVETRQQPEKDNSNIYENRRAQSNYERPQNGSDY